MKVFLLLIAVILTGGVWSQSLRQAQNLFDKYEYAQASAIFSQISQTQKLDIEDYKKMAYGYYISGDTKSCLPASDSLITINGIEPFFFYMNGEVNFAERNFDKAKASFEEYQKQDSEYDVKGKIASCDLIRNEVPNEFIINTLAEGNNTKANMTGERYQDGVIEFIELGQDSTGQFVDGVNIDAAELVIARPFIRMPGEDRQAITFDEEFRDAAITSFTLNDKTSEVWVTVAKPIAPNPIDRAPHLFQGKFDAMSLTVTDLKPWVYSGFEDSAACAHASLNETGDLMVFSKTGRQTKGADLFVSLLNGSEWVKPTEISRFNTEGDEIYPQFIGDTLITFASDGRPGFGGLDIYKSRIVYGAFGKPEHLPSPVNGFMDDFNFIYDQDVYHARYTSNRGGGPGDDDMYYIEYVVPDVPDTSPPIPDSADFHDFVNNYEAPIIYFDFDKFDLKDNLYKIDQLNKFLSQYPKSAIVVQGHTDRRGDETYNLQLSQNRATSVRNALIKTGIKADQITIQGLADNDPLNKCEICTEEMHAQNRYARIILKAK